MMQKNETTRVLCLLLNPRLSVKHIGTLTERYHVFVIQHDGKLNKGIIPNLRKQDPIVNFDGNETMNTWLAEGDNPVLGDFLEDQLCVLLSEQLTHIQIRMLMKVYKIIDVHHKGKQRMAIACAYYDPEQQLEGKILRKELIGIELK